LQDQELQAVQEPRIAQELQATQDHDQDLQAAVQALQPAQQPGQGAPLIQDLQATQVFEVSQEFQSGQDFQAAQDLQTPDGRLWTPAKDLEAAQVNAAYNIRFLLHYLFDSRAILDLFQYKN
jgi:hypothetical protein